MKLVYANVYYAPDSGIGGHAHIYQFIRCASQLGHEVWTWPIGHPDSLTLPNSRIGKLRAIRESDALIIRLEGGPPRILKLLRPPYRWLLGKTKIVWEFNTIPEFGEVIGSAASEIVTFVKTYRELARYCDLAVCVSDRLAEYVEQNLGIKHVITVPNGSDLKMFHPNLDPHPYVKERNTFNAIWMGSAGLGWANFDWLKEAARLLWENQDSRHICINILGGELKGLSEMTPNVRYLGSSRYEDVPRWLAGMDVGLISYRPGAADYSSPLKLFDYMASGLPVISTPQPQVSDILNGLGYGDFIISNNQPIQLAEALVKLDGDQELFNAYRGVMRKAAEERFSWTNSVATILNAIRALAEQKK